MKRLMILLTLVAVGLLAGCKTVPPISPTQSVGTSGTISLTEAAKRLDLTINDGNFWGDRYVYTQVKDGERDEFFIRSGKQFYTFNGLSRQVEYPGVTYVEANADTPADLQIPYGMYNSMCKDVGLIDRMIDDRIQVDVDEDYEVQKVEDIENDRPVIKIEEKAQPIAAPAPVKAEPKPEVNPAPTGALNGVKIVLDAGHGGKDPGAVVGQKYEKDIALAVTTRLQKLLEAAGAEVVLTRSGDTYPTLAERAGLANTVNADLFVSIHANAAANTSASGIETFYGGSGDRRSKSQRCADLVNDAMVAATGARDRGDKAETRGLHVLKHTKMPAILVECGFMTNSVELKQLFDESYRDKLASGIFQGLQKYLG